MTENDEKLVIVDISNGVGGDGGDENDSGSTVLMYVGLMVWWWYSWWWLVMTVLVRRIGLPGSGKDHIKGCRLTKKKK